MSVVARTHSAARARFTGSGAEHLWRRLDAMDFINRGMLLAAVLLLCFVPFMLSLQALAGRSAAGNIARRFGLSHQAAADVSHVLTSPSATSGAISGMGYLFLILSGIAAAAAIQELYEQAFDVGGRGIKDTPRRVVWLAAFVGATAFGGWAGPWLKDVGSPVLLGVFALVAFTGFWWFSMWLLLGGRRTWGELFPAALATGICWLGMSIVFRITMSDSITSDYRKYGSIGVVFAIMSFLIAAGVVIILGAVFGVVWRERHDLADPSP